MATRPVVEAFLAAHPTATAAQLSETFALPTATAHRWRNDWESKVASNAPADSLAQEDRDVALSIVRETYGLLNTRIQHLATIDTESPLPEKETRALLNLQKLAAGVIGAHPGLLDLTSDGKAPIATKDDNDKFLQALEDLEN